MRTVALFEYACPECGLGTVKTTRVLNYKTKIKGYPFTVDEAFIGVCDHCGGESFAPEETKRWEDLFYRSLEVRQAFLSPAEIAELRTELGLSMEDFARLIGCTRQSISAWEKQDRSSPPSRMADLLMKLVRQSLRAAPLDVLGFLLEEAKKWGVVIEIRRGAVLPEDRPSIVLVPRPMRQSARRERARELTLAAETDSEDEDVIAMETSDGKTIGKLEFDFERAALILEVTGYFPSWNTADVEIETRDGRHFERERVQIQKGRQVLQEKPVLREGEIARIKFSPHREQKER